MDNYVTVHMIHNSPTLHMNNDSSVCEWSHVLIQNQHFGDYLHMFYMCSVIDCFMYRLFKPKQSARQHQQSACFHKLRFKRPSLKNFAELSVDGRCLSRKHLWKLGTITKEGLNGKLSFTLRAEILSGAEIPLLVQTKAQYRPRSEKTTSSFRLVYQQFWRGTSFHLGQASLLQSRDFSLPQPKEGSKKNDLLPYGLFAVFAFLIHLIVSGHLKKYLLKKDKLNTNISFQIMIYFLKEKKQQY